MDKHDADTMGEYVAPCYCESGEKAGSCCRKDEACPCGDENMTVADCGMQYTY